MLGEKDEGREEEDIIGGGRNLFNLRIGELGGLDTEKAGMKRKSKKIK